MISTQTLDKISLFSEHDEKPETNKNYLRLVSNHLCPFVERARLALEAKKLQYQELEVDLQRKTKWHLDLNGGLVPVLETTDGKLICESDVIMEHLDNAYKGQGYDLYPSDPEKLAAMKIDSSKLQDGLTANFYGALFARGSPQSIEGLIQYLEKTEKLFEEFNKENVFALDQPHPTFADLLMLPHLDRLY